MEYFQPLSFTEIIGENHRIDIIINTFAIEDGKPEIESVTYDDSSVATILVGSSGKIAVNDKTYRMTDGDQLLV